MENKNFFVTNILNNTDIIITGGKNDGFVQDDTFSIIDEKEEVIEDPKTKEILDTIQRYKDTLVVKEIREKYTILTSRTIDLNSTNSLADIDASIFKKISKQRSYKKELSVKKEQQNDIMKRHSYRTIFVGDTVIKNWLLVFFSIIG